MKALRIKLRQNKASYTREETIDNRMTYPLPPFSTVIGAIHNACGYEEYHPMDISIQGKYGSMQKEIFVSNYLLNRRENDRNILAYFHNPNLLTAGYIQVGEGLKGQGNSFLERKTVRIDNEDLYKEYLRLESLRVSLNKEKELDIKPKIALLKDREKEIKVEAKKWDKKSPEFLKLKYEMDNIKTEYKALDQDFRKRMEQEYTIPTSHFRTLVKAPKYQEVLYEIELVIHIHAEDSTIDDIAENILNLTSIGRSEDFVDLLDCREVNLMVPEEDVFLKNGYKIYANIDEVNLPNEYTKPYLFTIEESNVPANGTVYYLNKNYEIIDNKRNFHRVPCIYSSKIMNKADLGLVDNDNYIVCLN